jgi:hypothetical protein
MSNKNFGEPWEGKIERIRENLREGRYALEDGIFPIVKELIQNAEDAKAERLLIAWSEGLQEAHHPLLHGPALLAINDGGFDTANSRAIREMGLSSKAADSSSIGKFGLGMKSVFHIGEVFYFIAVGADGRRIDADIRNPWSADVCGLHPDWDDFCDEDAHAVEVRARSLFGGDRWFCLWVPLRKRLQTAGVDPIEPFFPGDQPPGELLGASQASRVAPLLPLLSHLQSIELMLGDRSSFSCQVECESSRRRPLDAPPATSSPDERSFGGTIASTGSGQGKVLFAGEECRPRDGHLDETARHKNWPRRFATDRATGRSIQVAEKASPHAAVCCAASSMPAGGGQVRLQWAVFLPLGKPETIPVPLCPWSFDLFLHGWFFPNSGRTAVESLDVNETSGPTEGSGSAAVRHSWNHRLARIGTLPLVPTTLAAIARKCEWDDRTAASLTAALQRSQLMLRFSADVCRRNMWIRRLTPDGSCRWQAVPADTPWYTIPNVDPEGRALAVFPGLREAAAKSVIAFHNSPRLAASPPHRWPATAVADLLRTMPIDDLASSADILNYLTRFLDESATEQAWSVYAGELTALSLSALRAARGTVPKEARPALELFLLRLPGARRVRLRFEVTDEFAADVYAVLCESTHSVVWIPDGIDCPEPTCIGRITAAEALHILRRLAGWRPRKLSAAENERLGAVVAQVIRTTSELGRLLDEAGGMELFSGTSCRERKDIRLSWNSIIQHHRRRVLFVKPSPMAYQLQEAIQDTDIILVSAGLTQAIYGQQPDVPAQCREGQLLAALSASEKPRLGPAHNRRKVFDTLLKFRDGRREPSFRECVRYLMHGEPGRFSAADSLLVQGHDGSTVWLRVARLALSATGQMWRIVDPTFSAVLSEEDRREFGVEVVGPEVALRLASGVGPDCFEPLRPTEAEYRDLLRNILDDELLRRLPIHQDLDGRFVSLGEGCFWESDRVLPSGLRDNVCILKRMPDEPTWKRQRQLADPLNPAAIIGIALSLSDPSGHWQLIMDCLGDADYFSFSQEVSRRLKTAAWVPTADGAAVKPEDVIHLRELRDDVARLVSEYPGIFIDPERLAPALREHQGYRRFLEAVVPPSSEALVMLGTLLLKNPQNPVGDAGVTLEDWLEAFHDDDGTLFPCIHLLRAASERLAGAARATFSELARPIPEARTWSFVTWLSAHAASSSVARRAKIIRVFGQYLRTVVTADTFAHQIQNQIFPARDGTWRPARELCLGNDGVAACHVLDRKIEEDLAPFFPSSLQGASPFAGNNSNGRALLREPDWDVQAAAGRLRAYFDPWRDVIPNEQIGGFLALLGDDQSVRELAQEFLGRYRTLEETREKFGLPQMPGGHESATGQLIVEDGPTMISKQRVVVEIADEPTVPVLSLLGEPILLPRNERPATLFVGYGSRANLFPHRVNDGLRVRCFRLNAVDPRAFSGSDLSLLLRDSAVKFIAEAYNSFEHQTRGFSITWDELSASDQLDIRVTQSRIIEHGFLILDQYGLRSDPELARVLERWDTAERLKAERETQADGPRRSTGRNPERELQGAREQLRDLLENRQETQRHILAAIRRRIADYYQYKPDSIPFELFQNADDAYAELFHFFPEAAAGDRAPEPFFRLVVQGNRVVFLQAGRRINQYPADRDSSAHGFDNDLWKMSVLSLSNKGQSEDQPAAAVTGKFGLGFKSVFLACDRPRLLSGRLAFEFVGGIYPRRLIGRERSSLDELRNREGRADPQVTVIELGLRDALGPAQVAERFERLAHVLVVFARQIRHCICGAEGRETHWQPVEVPGVPGCRSGEVKPLEPGRGMAARRTVLFESDAGALLFGLGSRGFEPFEPEIPTVWVTAPTEERLQVGFLLNGPFALDVGRAQLARDPEQNRAAAVRLGQSFCEGVGRLFSAFEAAASRGPVQQALRLAVDVSPFDLWNSLWEMLVVSVSQRASRDEPAERLVRDVLWASTDGGAAGFVAAHPVIPVRLPGKRFERQLVTLSDIGYAVRGVLSRDDGFALAAIVEWPGVKARLGGRCLVSHQKVIEPLRLVCPRLASCIEVIGLPEVLRWELPHDDVSPQQADRLGAVIDKRSLERCDPVERQALEDRFAKLEFKAADGRYHRAGRLLIGHAPLGTGGGKQPDESRRAAFAPQDRVLSSENRADGLSFFETCRGRLDAPVHELAGWVLAARDQPTRQAALDYLADGELSPELQKALRQRGLSGTWLAELAASAEFRGMDIRQQGRLLGLLPLPQAEQILADAREVLAPRPSYRPEDVLHRMHEWWQGHRVTELADYERRLYPAGGLRFLADSAEEHVLQRRKDWMSLFLIGLTHTMGRTVAEQHRGFLRRCDQEGRLDMFARSDRDPSPWMKWIDGFLDGQIDESRFLQWMKQFVGIYQLSRHLDDYVEAFLAVERLRHPFALTQVTNTRASAVFQGGGVSAPPLSRVLGMGQCFVLREIVRRGILTNRHAHPHCFVPVARVRRMLLQMGCEELSQRQRPWEWSRSIHRFLVGHLGPAAATFHGDFDIPLQVVAEDPRLQAMFFTAAIDFEDDEAGLPFGDGDATASGEE